MLGGSWMNSLFCVFVLWFLDWFLCVVLGVLLYLFIVLI